MIKTTQLEREVALQKQALAESAQRIQELLEENARAAALATQQTLDAAALREAEDAAERSYGVLHKKQTRIDELEASMAEQRRLLTATNTACSSREASLNDSTRQRLEAMQQDLDAVVLREGSPSG